MTRKTKGRAMNDAIGPDGDKRFLTGGRVAGCYFSIAARQAAGSLVHR
jgi:phage/plasmid primase-like uncharacterized protein